MGYHTDFSGQFNLDKPLTIAQVEYLKAFSNTRRMKRNSGQTVLYPDARREAIGLPVGEQGAYYVGAIDGEICAGQDHTPDIIDYNSPPVGQPGLWCQWEPTNDGTAIEWNGTEKFYDYVEWIQYLIEHFLQPWGYVLNGEVEWNGEERGDFGIIVVKDNKVTTKVGRITYN